MHARLKTSDLKTGTKDVPDTESESYVLDIQAVQVEN
jgi:hypothetical protein